MAWWVPSMNNICTAIYIKGHLAISLWKVWTSQTRSKNQSMHKNAHIQKFHSQNNHLGACSVLIEPFSPAVGSDSSTTAYTTRPYWQYPNPVAWNQARSTLTPCLIKEGFAWVSSQLRTGRNVGCRRPRRTKRKCAFNPATSRYQVVGGTDCKTEQNI